VLQRHARFVQRSVVADFMERRGAHPRLRIGDPLDPATQVGSLISQAHMDTVLKYVELGRAKRAAGHRWPACDDGAWQGILRRAAVFDLCGDQMRIVREEIFGL